MSNKRILIIGDVTTDFHNDFAENELRLGGIFHSARGFSALKADYFLAYFCSEYQTSHIKKISTELNCKGIINLGLYVERPNVMVINDSTETGDQGYRNVLRLAVKIEYSLEKFEEFITENDITDALIYPSCFDIDKQIETLRNRKIDIHIDTQYTEKIPKNIKTLITSSTALHLINSFNELKEIAASNCIEQVLFKQNRGGSVFCRIKSTENYYITPAYSIETIHSVGVGDVFNAILISQETVDKDTLDLCSKAAALYATTMSQNDFESSFAKLMGGGIDLIPYPISNYEERSEFLIYLAAPDFPNSITKIIANNIESKLQHHNFKLFRPIVSNGLIDNSTSNSDQKIIYMKDKEAIYKAKLCIAILDEDDTGTAAEIGMFKAIGKPVLGYSTRKRFLNNFLLESLSIYTTDLKQLIEYVYMNWK